MAAYRAGMSRRRASGSVRAAAEARLAAVAAEWRPGAPVVDAPTPVPAIRLTGWAGPAMRGLAVLTAAVVAIAGYAVWQSRPRPVVDAPLTLATGPALTGGDSAPPMDTALTVASTAPADRAPAPSPATPGAAEVVVHVTGLVARPGLVRLPAGSRVADAIAEAGGVTQRRAADSVNLARVLADGEQVVVSLTPGPSGPSATGPTAPAVVDLNTATVESLDALPGIGPVIATRIVAWRAANGPFRTIEELGEVSGIGDAILAQLRSLVRV